MNFPWYLSKFVPILLRVMTMTSCSFVSIWKAAAEAAPNVQTVYIDKATGLPARNVVTPENDDKKRLFDGTFSLRDDLKIEPPKS